MNVITAPDQPAYHFDNAFAQSSRESFPDETNSAEGRSSEGAERSSPSYNLSTVHSGAPLEVLVSILFIEWPQHRLYCIQ